MTTLTVKTACIGHFGVIFLTILTIIIISLKPQRGSQSDVFQTGISGLLKPAARFGTTGFILNGAHLLKTTPPA